MNEEKEEAIKFDWRLKVKTEVYGDLIQCRSTYSRLLRSERWILDSMISARKLNKPTW